MISSQFLKSVIISGILIAPISFAHAAPDSPWIAPDAVCTLENAYDLTGKKRIEPPKSEGKWKLCVKETQKNRIFRSIRHNSYTIDG